jgi:transketolase
MTAKMRLAWLPREEFVRVLNGISDRRDRARTFATLSRINTLYMIRRAGSGHVGSSFSAADLVSWLLLEEMQERGQTDSDIYFSSKGHDVPGLYASLIGLGRLPENLLHRLRRLDGLPGHPDVGTPHMPFNTGSLGMGVSKAKGLVLADRLAGRRRRIHVLTGDGELQEGQIWESLPTAAHQLMGELTVIVDHNKIQSDTWVHDVNDLGDLEARFASCGWGVLRCDGHDVAQLEETFRRRALEFPDRPVAVIADTVKGAGTRRFAATSMAPGEWRYRFHSGAPSPEDYEAAHAELVQSADELLDQHGLSRLALRTTDVPVPVPVAGQRLPEVYGRVLAERAAHDERIVALDADLVLDTGLIPFRDAHPDRFIECGIAEQDMVSMAGGLAAGGLLPFVHSFSCFLHSRPNEQIYNNATERRRVVYVGSLAGVLPGGPGHSHQAVRDIAALTAVPGLVMVAPASPAQTEAAVDYCRTAPDSVYLRLSSLPCSPEVAGLPVGSMTTGRGQVVRVGNGEIVAVGAGPVVLTELLRAAGALATEGIEVTVINLPWLNRVDERWLSEVTTDAKWLFVVEEHYERGGQADTLARALLDLAPRGIPQFRGIGLTGIPRCGTADEVLGAHGLRADLLADAFRGCMPSSSTDCTSPTMPSVQTQRSGFSEDRA